MAVSKLTQRFVDDLLGAEPPDKDAFYWSERMPGFGAKHKATSGGVSFVMQWRDRRTGQSHRLALGDARQVKLDVARKLAEERFAEIAAGRNPMAEKRLARAAPTFQALVEVYLASPAWQRKAPSTRTADEARIASFLLPALGSRKVADLTLADMRKLHRDLCDPAKAQALARAAGPTRNIRRGGEGGARRTMRLLKAILSFAVEEFELPENPAARLKLGTDGTRDAVLDEEAYGRLWSAIEKLRTMSYTMQRACDCIAVLALTGARRSEIRQLRWRHVDLDGRRITLPRDEHKAGRKTGRSRVIALPDEAVAILAGYPHGEPDALIFSGQRFTRPVALDDPWELISEEAELPPEITLHSLRHGVGTLLAAEGLAAPQIAMALGHAQWRTSERYVHVVDRARDELARKTAALVRPKKLRPVE
jgi:integrase